MYTFAVSACNIQSNKQKRVDQKTINRVIYTLYSKTPNVWVPKMSLK